jgi:hypothetical protein
MSCEQAAVVIGWDPPKKRARVPSLGSLGERASERARGRRKVARNERRALAERKKRTCCGMARASAGAWWVLAEEATLLVTTPRSDVVRSATSVCVCVRRLGNVAVCRMGLLAGHCCCCCCCRRWLLGWLGLDLIMDGLGRAVAISPNRQGT